MNIGRLFRKRRQVDRGALERALAMPVDEMSRGIPLDTAVPVTPATRVVISHLSLLIVIYGLDIVWLRWRTPSVLELTGVAAASLLVIASSLIHGGLNPDRRLYISEQGIRLDRLFGSQAIEWWAIRGIRAKPDLSELRLDASRGGMTIHTSGMTREDARANTLMALRARLDPAVPIEAWAPSWISRESLANVGGATGSMLLMLSLYLVPLSSTHALGIRCSGPSRYLDARFGLPSGQPGCVVIRVSGSAARAGVRLGDRMVAMNGAPISSGSQFNDRFFNENATAFEFTVVRRDVADPVNIHVDLTGGPSPNTPDSDPIAWFLRARGNPDIQQSIRQYTRAIQLAPDFDLAYVFRGELELENDRAAALADIEQALALNSGSAEVYIALASYYQAEIFMDAAVPELYVRRAIELDGCDGGFLETNVDCERDYVVLADLLRFRADTLESIEAAKQAIPYYPRAAGPLYELALSYEVAGDNVQAASYARQYLRSTAFDRTDGESKDMLSLLNRVRAGS